MLYQQSHTCIQSHHEITHLYGNSTKSNKKSNKSVSTVSASCFQNKLPRSESVDDSWMCGNVGKINCRKLNTHTHIQQIFSRSIWVSPVVSQSPTMISCHTTSIIIISITLYHTISYIVSYLIVLYQS